MLADPGAAAGWLALAQAAGPEAAAAAYRRAWWCAPDALPLLRLNQLGRPDMVAALATVRHANPWVLGQLGYALERTSPTAALQAYGRMALVEPGHGGGWYRLALTWQAVDPAGAIAACRRAGCLGHAPAPLAKLLAALLLQVARRDGGGYTARGAAARLAAVAPENWWSCYKAASLAFRDGDSAAALRWFQRACAAGLPGERLFGARLAHQVGRWREAQGFLHAAIATGEAEQKLPQWLGLALANPGCDDRGIAALQSRLWQTLGALTPARRPPRRRAGRRPRIAYLGAELAHGGLAVVRPVLAAHAADADVALYVLEPRADRPDRPQLGCRPREHVRHDAGALAAELRAAELDLLIDLGFFSAPSCLPLLRSRLAMRQISWSNALAPAAAPWLDGIVADRRCVTPAEAAAHYPEPVLYAETSFLAWDGGHATPAAAPLPALRPDAAGVTFGCTARGLKLTAAVLDAWARILAAVPRSRLLIRNDELFFPWTAARYHRALAARGIAPERLACEPPAAYAEFIHTYDRIDIALDPFPWTGGITTLEALWQGVPVVTLEGDRFAGRVSASVLAAAGLEALIAPDLDGYVARAVALAGDLAALAERRAGLRDHVRRSPLTDGRRIARVLEGALA